MSDIFVDTSGWGNLLDSGQPWHSLAAALYHDARRSRRKVVTTNYILSELAALLMSPLRVPRRRIIALLESVRNSPFVEIVHVTPSLDLETWEIFRRYPDKNWSWVDCASFALMKERGFTEALTADYHFEQAGFVCMLKAG